MAARPRRASSHSSRAPPGAGGDEVEGGGAVEAGAGREADGTVAEGEVLAGIPATLGHVAA
nr:hypothetical protein GCM10010200_003850 [Actinomadura rugatobispora]